MNWISLRHRIDAQKKCATGYSCGASCISMNKTCRKSPGAGPNRQKMQRILALAAGKEGGPAMGGGARAREGSKEREQQSPAAKGPAKAMTTRELRAAVLKAFGVKTTAALLANKSFRRLTAGDEPRTFKGKNENEEWRQIYRRLIAVPRDERNLPDGGSVINGIDILKNFRPWVAFGLDPETAKNSDIDKAFRKLATKHHPDAGGDRRVFERLVSMKNSLKAMRGDALQRRLDALRTQCY